MRLSDEIRDPWALLLGVVAGGAAWAVGVPVAAAAAVGAAVLGVKALLGSVGLKRPPKGPGQLRARLLPIRGNSPEERWVRRAERAARSFNDMSRSSSPGPIAERCDAIGAQAATTLDAMRRLAGQTSAIGSALRRIDEVQLRADHARLGADVKRAKSADLRLELERSLASVQAQLEVNRRLADAGRTLLARLQSGAIGLEALVARLAEVLAMSASASSPQLDKIDELADELEGLRSGIAETEDVTRRALTAYEAQEQRGA